MDVTVRPSAGRRFATPSRSPTRPTTRPALAALPFAPSRAAARPFSFALVLAYHVSYADYFAIPGLGPRFTLAAKQTVSVHDTPVSRAIDDTLNKMEQTKYDVFPSGHTMIACVTLIVAFQRLRRSFWFFLPVATCLVISTIYCRYHYAIDVIAGILLAALVVPLGDRLYDHLVKTRVAGLRPAIKPGCEGRRGRRRTFRPRGPAPGPSTREWTAVTPARLVRRGMAGWPCHWIGRSYIR